MSVSPKHYRRSAAVAAPKGLVAADLLNTAHPLHESLKRYCGEHPITKRKAAEFLAKYPQYRQGLHGKVAAAVAKAA